MILKCISFLFLTDIVTSLVLNKKHIPNLSEISNVESRYNKFLARGLSFIKFLEHIKEQNSYISERFCVNKWALSLIKSFMH